LSTDGFCFDEDLQMDALVFGKEELSGFIPKTLFKAIAMVVVVS
jgi:hypothetical protein